MVEPGSASDPIVCHLQHVDLDGSFAYKAISYTWGDPSQTQLISVDGQPFPVTVNLASALGSLRSSSDELKIWADAVCIDQGNIPEVNRSVARMKYIYERAAEVIVWIGEEEPGDAKAMKFIGDLHSNWESDEWWNQSLQSADIEEKATRIHGILTREYWSRAWVVQETMFNKNITIRCGSSSIPWSFLDFSVVTEKRGADLRKLPGAISLGLLRLMRNSGAGTPGDPGVGGIPTAFDLLRTLIWHRQLNSTDPKDKVYAFVGLLDPTCPAYEVDYELSVQQVYTNAVTYLIATTRCLDVIGTTQTALNTLDLPSWVPDWQRQPDSTSVNLLRLRQEDPTFSASGFVEPKWELLDNDKVLSVKGWRVGALQNLGIPCHVESMTQDTNHKEAAFKSFLDWYQLLAQHKSSEEQDMIDFFRVLSCDYACSSNASGRINVSARLVAQNTISSVASMAEEMGQLQALPEQLLRITMDDSWRTARDDVGIASTTFMQDRRFFVSSIGLMGLAPARAEKDDLICIIMGCTHPIVLRPKGECFEVIGEAFVHGLMYGEWMGDKSQRESERVFNLR